ncbi:MAG: choice-of-anchor D domain-containing protein [Candidatus Acidiferrales bacterium]
MSSSTRWKYFHAAFPVHLLTLLILAVCSLGIASRASAQVTSTPANKIFKTPGTQTFSISVPSGTTLGSVSVLTLGAPNLDFTEVAGGTSCPNVTAGACTVEVQFQPTAAGRRQGSVVLSDASGNMLLSISLDGTGTQPMAAFTPGIISTFAGGGTGEITGQATSAKLAVPTGVAIDGFGNYYVADQKANKVYKVTPAGVISTFAGTGTAGFSGDGGPAINAELNGPMDVIVDGAGYVYISDTNNNVVRMVNTAGTISTYAGQYYPAGGTPPAVCATATNSVGDGCPGNQMVLNTPVGLVFCHAQNLHIADELHNRVRTVNRVGYMTLTQVGDGTQGYNGDGEGNTSAELNGPTGLDMDAANFIYVADTGNHIIRKTLLTGTTPNPISTVAGTPGAAGDTGDGGLAISAELNSPRGVRADAAGDLYISDYGSNVIRVVNAATGKISTVVGTGTAGYSGDGGAASSAELNAPFDIFLDQDGNLYIADSQNAVIRKLDVFDAPALTFPATAMGTTSAAQDVTVANIGSAPLTISQITVPASFSIGGSETSCATSSETLNPGENCALGIEFSPLSAGNVTGSMVLTDNSTPTTQTIALSGATSSASAGSSYTLTAQTPTVSMNAGSTGTDMLTVTSNNYAGTVSFTTSVTSTDGTAANVTATATPVTVASGATGTSTLTISANADAANRAPASPWESGGTAMFCAFLIGLPFISRKRRLMALLTLAIPIALAGSLMACGGTNTTRKKTAQPRTYIVTATPTASAQGSTTVTNPAPVTITVTVQ